MTGKKELVHLKNIFINSLQEAKDTKTNRTSKYSFFANSVTQLFRFVELLSFFYRDFSSKEVAVYNSMHRVEPVFIPTLTTKVSKNLSATKVLKVYCKSHHLCGYVIGLLLVKSEIQTPSRPPTTLLIDLL